MMNGKFAAGSTVLIVLPSESSIEYRRAASVLRQELERRSSLNASVTPTSENLDCSNAAFVVQLLTVDDLTDEVQNQIDPPIKIFPFPDYADHINLRTQEDGSTKKILVICGSSQSLIYGVGSLFRFFRFDDDGVSLDLTFFDMQPLTPLRGCFFEDNRKEISFSAFSTEQWNEIALNQALWGNNVLGFNSEEAINCNTGADSQSLLCRCDLDSKWLEDKNVRFIWLKTGAPDSSLEDYYTKIHSKIGLLADGNREFWLDCDTYPEDQLSELFDILIKETNLNVNALVCGSDHPFFYTIKREMPLTMQLISTSCISESLWSSPGFLAKRFFDCAPLTYGALFVSHSLEDELSRYIWSLLSWSPQPEINELAELYGQCFFGSPVASAINESILAYDEGDPRAIHYLERAKTLIPTCMTGVAEPRFSMIKSLFERENSGR